MADRDEHDQIIGQMQLPLEPPSFTCVRVKTEFSVDLSHGSVYWWLTSAVGENGDPAARLVGCSTHIDSFAEHLEQLRYVTQALVETYLEPF